MGKETPVLIMRESLQLRYMYTLCTVGTHCANQEQSKGNNSKQYSFDVNSVSNKVNKLHTSIGLTGVIKEALILSFLLIPGKTPAFDSFFCRHRCTTSVRLFDA